MRESPTAKVAFAEYCALGTGRTLEMLHRTWKRPDGKPATNLRQIEEWSRLHNWQARVSLYDIEKTQERERKKQAKIDKMNERHGLIGTTQQAKAIEQIQQLIEAKKFGSQAVVQLLKLATDLERLALGAPTEHTELSGPEGGPVQAVFYLPKVEHEEGYDG